MTGVVDDILPKQGMTDLSGTKSESGAVRCVFSTLDAMKVGTGTTTRKHLSKIYWYVEEVAEERFSVRRINAHHVPSGDAEVISLNSLVDDYTPEVEFFEGNTIPAMELLEEYLNEGTEQREQGRLYSAQDSFSRALGMEEKNVRALFNLGLIYMALHDTNKARDMMRELLNIRSTFDGKDQFLFNEFGISLRKNGLFDEAAAYYGKALEFVQDDENLYYNLARAHYERGKWNECVEAIGKSRELNPRLEASASLGELIMELADNTALREQYNKPPIPKETADVLSQVMRVRIAYDQEPGAGETPEGRARTGSGASREDLKFDI
jgi:tetratricopeptide (TPR) repeat protein